jgi:2-oxoglutarate ferredoxin oxidoreductase subunit gamma
VVIGDKRIGSPIIKNPTHLVAMNRPSLEKFANDVKPGGVILINSSLIPTRSEREDITELIVPANDSAIKVGSIKCANIIALSAFAAKTNIVDLELLKKCVKEEFSAKPKIIPLNMNAFDEGVNIANKG